GRGDKGDRRQRIRENARWRKGRKEIGRMETKETKETEERENGRWRKHGGKIILECYSKSYICDIL
ncbi:hypothetical protein MD537_22670, partial [Flavihumibacter sediminis]|nr:hypothetical protein [Flavihumibacter sediminis]